MGDMAESGMNVCLVGGGMFVHDVILPSLYHQQRTGVIGEITVCATKSASLRKLAANPELQAAFPGQTFRPYPALDASDDICDAELYRTVLSKLPPRQAVIVALPDPLHHEAVMSALGHDQHVLCVKPLVLTHRESMEISQRARERGLFVGVEYHKRFDRRSLIARGDYRLGKFGSFAFGEARLMEPYHYRNSNFQNWFTCDQTDPFVYVGCHYTDLLQFITGLRPVEVAVIGVKGVFPNGNEGYMWSTGRVTYENGGVLTVANGLGYPDEGAGSNDQGMTLYFEGDGRTGAIKHDDQYRGVSHSYAVGTGPGGTAFNFVNPDFMRYLPWEGPGFRPAGYGFESISGILAAIQRVEASGDDREARLATITAIDKKGLIATPENSADNERLIEAARESILNDGRPVIIQPV